MQTKIHITPTTNSEATSNVTTLRDIGKVGTTRVAHNALLGVNLGNNTLIAAIPMYKFYEMSEVANTKTVREYAEEGEELEVTQRPLDAAHAARLGTYMLKGMVMATVTELTLRGEPISDALSRIQAALGTQPYIALQPIVANLNTKPEDLVVESTRTGVLTVYLSDGDVLWVIDGQHRRFAMQLAFDFLRFVRDRREYPKRQKIYAPPTPITADDVTAWSEIFEIGRQHCNIVVEIHLGLSDDAERQLFHDLNNLGKKVEASLSFAFDNSNPVNRYIKDELEPAPFFKPQIATKDIVNWKDDPGVITRKDLMAVNAQLFLNKTNVGGAQPLDIAYKKELANTFWEAVNKIRGFGQVHAKQTTVAAQPVVLKAIAKLFFNFAWGKQSNVEHLRVLLNGITGAIDFSHDNPMWRYYELTSDEIRELGLTGLESYLPSDSDGNRDIGKFDDGVMRFGAKHNDIFPILGDMIRWRLGLPSRQTPKENATLSTTPV